MISLYKSYHGVAEPATHIPLHGGTGAGVVPRSRLGTGKQQVRLGTIACTVTSNTDGRKYLLANRHHLIGETGDGLPTTTIGDYLTAGALYNNIVGSVYSDKPSVTGQYMDAALAAPTVPTTDYINMMGIPKGHVEPQVGMSVRWMGALTYTKQNYPQSGKIVSLGDYDLADSLSSKQLADWKKTGLPTLRRGVFFMDIPPIGGDSGSAIVNDEGYVVGLFYGYIPKKKGGASSDPGSVSLGCRASTIAKTYNVNFVGSSAIYDPMAKPAIVPPTPAKLPSTAIIKPASPLRNNAMPSPTPPGPASGVSPLSSSSSILGIDNNTLLLALGGLVLLVVILK